ncbi:MAG: AmmeMemoRadiSam system radical SAM enzyme, partial [Sulfuricella sp.]|nr:AmmeMemoRadiSam system radical SAM enzyme [Sulfuricella sp.]
LIIPGHNDTDEELTALSRWVFKELGADVPLHFSAFHPDYKMMDVPSTPFATLTRARHIAMKEGLRYVYTGNVHDPAGDTTYCPSCKKPLIVRDWYQINAYRLTDDGHCPDCGTAIAGRFEKFVEAFGSRRIPVAMHAYR